MTFNEVVEEQANSRRKVEDIKKEESLAIDMKTKHEKKKPLTFQYYKDLFKKFNPKKKPKTMCHL